MEYSNNKTYPWVRKIPWRRKWQITPVFLPGNPMDRGTWQATVHGVTERWTRLSIHTHTHTHTHSQYVAHIQTLDNAPWGNSYCRLESCWTDFDMANYLIKWSSTDIWKASSIFPESQNVGNSAGIFQGIGLCYLLLLFTMYWRDEIKLNKN